MKKKQVALLLAALMCITPVAESAAVMGAEFSSGEETVEMQGTEEEAEAEDTAEIWTSGEEVSDFGTDEAPEVDGFTSEESEASTDAAGAKQVKGSFEVAYITEEQYNNALQNEERPEVDMKTVEDTTFSNALNSIEGENTGYCFVRVQDLEDAADFVAPEGMTVLVENARARSITPNGNIAFWGMIDPSETIEIKEGKGTTTFFCQDMRSVLKGTGSDDKVIFCGQNNTIGGISGVENIYLRNNSHDLQVFGASEFFNIYNETDNIKNHPQEENAFFIHIVNSKTAPVFHKTFDWGTGEFENENGEKWSSPYGIGIIYNTSDEKNEWEELVRPYDLQILKVAEEMPEKYNILHICGEPEYQFETHVEWFKNYPADLINWSVKDNHFSLEQGRELYSSAILGGMNNKGNVLNGSEDAIREEVKGILDAFGTKGIMIGADCTIQGENISLDLIKTAVEAAHAYKK